MFIQLFPKVFDKLANKENYFDKDNYVSNNYLYRYAFSEIYDINPKLALFFPEYGDTISIELTPNLS